MYATRVAAFALVAVLSLVMPAKADYYANFFDDDNCSVNGGIGVSLKNPGCLAEGGRGSVYIPNTGLGPFDDNQFCLVITSNSGVCNCQNVGYNFKATGFCHQLNPSDQSYRFISGACGHNNC